MQPFTERVVAIIKSIPAGQVASYGQIAELAGSRRGARQVVRILHSMSMKYDLPWHRVVNSKGEIAVADEEARDTQVYRLEQEGVYVDHLNRVDLEACRFIPSHDIVDPPSL
ncbi:MGMT family protein [Paenibacillus sp. GCM10023252]|uniref:MGMT family protein n=1 Tax=Paenibacillus sp. GCM10023252 TaxID=3252649 RepID=UPI00361A23CF